MAYSQTLNLVTGDSLPILTMTLRDSNAPAAGYTLDENDPITWAPINITGATVTMYVRLIGSTVLKDTLIGSILDGAGGRVAITFDETTFDEAGQYEGEIEVTFSGGGVQTINDLIKFKVRADL